MKIFILKDKLTNKPAGVPFFSENKYSALRDVMHNFKNEDVDVLIQFELYEIGEFSPDGYITNSDVEVICCLKDAKTIINKHLAGE